MHAQILLVYLMLFLGGCSTDDEDRGFGDNFVRNFYPHDLSPKWSVGEEGNLKILAPGNVTGYGQAIAGGSFLNGQNQDIFAALDFSITVDSVWSDKPAALRLIARQNGNSSVSGGISWSGNTRHPHAFVKVDGSIVATSGSLSSVSSGTLWLTVHTDPASDPDVPTSFLTVWLGQTIDGANVTTQLAQYKKSGLRQGGSAGFEVVSDDAAVAFALHKFSSGVATSVSPP